MTTTWAAAVAMSSTHCGCGSRWCGSRSIDRGRTRAGGHAMNVVLEVVEGPHQGIRLEFDKPESLMVGRGASAQLQLTEDAHFSRNHFTLEFDPPACRL